MDILVAFGGVVGLICMMICISCTNEKQFSMGPTIFFVVVLLLIEGICVGLLYGMRQDPILEMTYHTKERRTEIARRVVHPVDPPKRSIEESEYVYTYHCIVDLELDYQFAILMSNGTTIELPGNCHDYESIEQHPKVREVLYHWGL